MHWNARAFSGGIAAILASLVLAACGGGGGDAAPTSPGAGPTTPGTSPVTPPAAAKAAVYSGPITGFGSVIVNGVRFDTVGARLVDDDDSPIALQDLSLGTMVTIDGSADDTTLRGTARTLSRIRGNTGPISAIDLANQTLAVNGLTIKTSPSTAYKHVASLAALQPGDVVEVYGSIQTDNTVAATLIEKKGAQHTPRVVGRMSQLNATAKTFKVGTLTVNYAAARIHGNLADGRLVSVKADQAPVNHVLQATSVKVADGAANGTAVATGAYLKLKGVAEASPVGGELMVSGTRVNVSQAVLEYGPIVAGARLEVKGVWNGAVLMASKVEVERGSHGASGSNDRNELYGSVSQLTNEGGRTIATISGVLVDVTNAYFSRGNLAQLAVGSAVEVKGHIQGNLLIATKVEVKSGRDYEGYGYEQYGPISDFVSVANFRVNGVQVDASGARFEHGGAASLANGVYVEIKGAHNAAGVFVASKVEIKTGRRD